MTVFAILTQGLLCKGVTAQWWGSMLVAGPCQRVAPLLQRAGSKPNTHSLEHRGGVIFDWWFWSRITKVSWIAIEFIQSKSSGLSWKITGLHVKLKYVGENYLCFIFSLDFIFFDYNFIFLCKYSIMTITVGELSWENSQKYMGCHGSITPALFLLTRSDCGGSSSLVTMEEVQCL